MPTEDELLTKAVGGDQVMLQKLLVAHAGAVSRYAARRMPPLLRERMDPEDIVQLTFVEVFRSIGRFRPQEAGTFQAWLLGIADHVIKDSVKGNQRVKRGGQFRRVRHAEPTPSRSLTDLVELLSAGGHSPSYSVMGHEAVQAVQQAIADLPEDYGKAVHLRLLEGKSLEETATALDCSPRAVQGLVDRAKKKMRAALGHLSNYK